MRFGVPRKNVDSIFFAGADGAAADFGDKGFVFRHHEPTVPPAVSYGITERMKDIEKALAPLERLTRKWQQPAQAAAK